MSAMELCYEHKMILHVLWCLESFNTFHFSILQIYLGYHCLHIPPHHPKNNPAKLHESIFLASRKYNLLNKIRCIEYFPTLRLVVFRGQLRLLYILTHIDISTSCTTICYTFIALGSPFEFARAIQFSFILSTT